MGLIKLGACHRTDILLGTIGLRYKPKVAYAKRKGQMENGDSPRKTMNKIKRLRWQIPDFFRSNSMYPSEVELWLGIAVGAIHEVRRAVRRNHGN